MKCRNPDTYVIIPREDSVLARYKEQITEYSQKYHSILDQILVINYKFPSKNHEISNKICAIVNEETDKSFPLELFMPNDFPYYIDPEIYHYLLWNRKIECVTKDPKQLDQSVEAYIIQEIQQKGILNTKNIRAGKEFEFFWFENPIASRSIPQIWHIQIFWRLIDNDNDNDDSDNDDGDI